MEVLDFNLAAAGAECSGKEFGKTACAFPD